MEAVKDKPVLWIGGIGIVGLLALMFLRGKSGATPSPDSGLSGYGGFSGQNQSNTTDPSQQVAANATTTLSDYLAGITGSNNADIAHQQGLEQIREQASAFDLGGLITKATALVGLQNTADTNSTANVFQQGKNNNVLTLENANNQTSAGHNAFEELLNQQKETAAWLFSPAPNAQTEMSGTVTGGSPRTQTTPQTTTQNPFVLSGDTSSFPANINRKPWSRW